LNETDYRYEYRAFAPDFGLIESRLRKLGGAPRIRESQEIYLVAAYGVHQNIKLRGEQLDIKQRIAQRDGFEQWRPVGKWSFPLPVTARDILHEALGLGAALGDPECLELGALIQCLHAGRQVVIVDLFKRRFGFEIGACQAEIAEVSINGAALRTVCVESTDLAAARALTEALGLSDYPNVSYVQALMVVTGLSRSR
jgi:hypothetical protein